MTWRRWLIRWMYRAIRPGANFVFEPEYRMLTEEYAELAGDYARLRSQHMDLVNRDTRTAAQAEKDVRAQVEKNMMGHWVESWRFTRAVNECLTLRARLARVLRVAAGYRASLAYFRQFKRSLAHGKLSEWIRTGKVEIDEAD